MGCSPRNLSVPVQFPLLQEGPYLSLRGKKRGDGFFAVESRSEHFKVEMRPGRPSRIAAVGDELPCGDAVADLDDDAPVAQVPIASEGADAVEDEYVVSGVEPPMTICACAEPIGANNRSKPVQSDETMGRMVRFSMF